jgi:hypothetical protein
MIRQMTLTSPAGANALSALMRAPFACLRAGVAHSGGVVFTASAWRDLHTSRIRFKGVRSGAAHHDGWQPLTPTTPAGIVREGSGTGLDLLSAYPALTVYAPLTSATRTNAPVAHFGGRQSNQQDGITRRTSATPFTNGRFHAPATGRRRRAG